MKKKQVSVIIPTFSRPDNLCRAIDCVLAQSYQPIEIIVVDDNGIGTNYQIETENKIHSYIKDGTVKYLVHKTNKNGSAARNTGFYASTGEYICFLDDDDILDNSKIQKQVECLEKHTPDYGACYCNSIIYNKRRTYHTHNQKEGNLCYDLLTGKIEFNTSTILFRRQVLIELNGWDESFYRHQDWELMTRFFRNYKICIANKKEYLVSKYATPNVISKNPKRVIEYSNHFLRKMHDDIEKLSYPKMVYRAQAEMLSLNLMAAGEKKLGRKLFLKIFQYGLPSPIGCLKFIYYLIK